MNKAALKTFKHNIYGTLLDTSWIAAHLIYGYRWADHGTKAKPLLDGDEDILTKADTRAQQYYVERLSMHKGLGIVAEEEGLSVPCQVPGHDIWVSVDPLDGTKAFSRRQSHGFSTMTGLVDGTSVEAAVIVDVMSCDTYTYGPGVAKGKVHWFDRNHSRTFLVPSAKPLSALRVLMGKHPCEYSDEAQRLIRPHKRGGAFSNIEVDAGSIGLRIARLWKGEVGALLMKPRTTMPWDDVPIIGISKRLGFVFLRHAEASDEWIPFEPPIVKQPYRVEHETIVIHSSKLEEFQAHVRTTA